MKQSTQIEKTVTNTIACQPNPMNTDTPLQLMHRTVGQPFDEQAEHENDLRYESRQDFATWERDGDTGPEAE